MRPCLNEIGDDACDQYIAEDPLCAFSGTKRNECKKSCGVCEDVSGTGTAFICCLLFALPQNCEIFYSG